MTVDELEFRDLMARSHELREAFAELVTQSAAIRDEVQRRRATALSAAGRLGTRARRSRDPDIPS